MKRLRLLLLFVVLLALAPTTALAATVGTTTLADPSSASTWRNWGLENSTENVGRIWTDKTVSDGDIVLTGAGGEKVIPKEKGSDFLTAFSAISSTSNLRETATEPLDIVLVLDASGSMDDPMGRTDSTKRIDALKAAANSFIDEIAARNAGISEADQRHSVAVVKFSGDKTARVGNDTYRDGRYTYNYSQVMQGLTVVDTNGASNLKAKVNAISPAGATRSDYGLELAQSQLEGGRAGARKVVVFFTDGKPTKFSDFDSSVASNAITAAKAIKDSGGTVYTIGIFDGANPTASVDSGRTSDENKFMQAASNNYPDATYTSSWRDYTWSFGTRAEGSDFYKSATNADELKKVFDGISKEISDAAGYPTDVTDGLEHASGYVTFTDQLGDYMQVDDFNCIVFANQVFKAKTKTTSGNTDTYVFSGTAGNVLYPAGDLSSIVIEVRRSGEGDVRTGDHVTIKVPAALIPLRAFNVNADDNTGSVSLTFPIRVFFGSSLKPQAAALLANPDAQMADYMKTHRDKSGNVFFLASAWSGKANGDAAATFTPAEENSYYYITRDTPIYEDEALTQPAAYPLVKGKTYYYERTFWNISGTSASQGSRIVSFDSSAVESIDGYISDTGDGHAQFSQGTPRMTYINELHNDKSSNATKTATSFINPKWSGNQVFVWLGNNGKLSLPEPGSLEVSKTIVVPEGFDAAVYANQDFDFTVSIPEAKDKTVTGTVTDASGRVTGDANFSIAFDANGTYTHKLKGGQKLTITGLSAGWKYEVTEARRSGWTVSSEGASGSIAAGEKSVAAFTNTYGATGTLSGGTSLNGEKTLSGRAWTAQDKFCFVLTGIDGAPMPEGVSDGKAILQMTQSEGTPDNAAVPFHFGNITYTKPGTYVYNIVEARAGDGYDVSILPGMSVSQALYRVTVTVTDEAYDGTLKVESTMLRLKDDTGATLADGAGVKTDRAAFTNVFDVKEAEWDLRGTKNYEDKTGSRPLSSGMFQFELTAKTEGAPMPANTVGVKATANVDATGRFAFEQVTFDENDVNADKTPKSYEYELREVNSGVNGMTYDGTVWHITVTASLNEAGEVVFSVQNTREGQTAVPGETISFSNTYEATPATVQSFICGTKTLKGRDSLDGEKFAFSLTQTSGPEGGCAGFSPEVEVGDLADSEAKSFNFGTATFTKAGTYVFEVREVAPDQPAGGMTYDGHVYTVTVKIADQGGQLYVQSTTYSDEAARDVEAATFINTYAPADADYAGITVSKTLIGRTMREGEFNFTIKGEDEQSDALLASSDRAFANDGQRASGEKNAMTKLNGIVFNRTDAGEYRFKVAEVVPTVDAKLPGVTYDAVEHEVIITVEDALDGTLRVTTTVDDAPGNEVAFQNTYQATPGSFDTANFGLAKVLEGRDWASTDAFTFKLVGLSGAPMPANSQVTVKAADASSGRTPFDFGQISYAAAGTYEYEVCEVNAGQTVNGVDYTTNVAHFRVTVTDSTATGQLVASSRLVSGSAAFVNRYSAELDYNAMGGLSVTKTLEGTSAPAGKFGFTISTTGDDVLGIAGTYSSSEIADGGTVTVAATSGEIIFTQNDAGKTWKYEVSEDDPGKGFTCKCSKWNVSVSVANDVENGRLLVTTTVSGEGGTRSWTYASGGEPAAPGATVAFVNRYAATGTTAEIVGTKTLNGRLMSAREFEFQLVDEAGDVVATACNDEFGSVNFGRLSYTTPGTYTYTAREVTDGLKAEGVTPVRGSFTITVKVTDNGDGTLDCDVDYPKGGLAFENSYGTGDAEIEVSGTKVLEGRELRDGEFGFTITAKTDGAPMPERTEVTNAHGGFSFGKITFTLDNVFGGVVIQDADGEAGQSGEVPSDEKPVADSESEAGPRVEAPSSATGEKDAELELAAPETEPVSDPSDSPAPAEEPQQDELLAQDEVADLGTPVVEEVSASDAEAASTPDATDVATVNAARWQTVRRNLFHIASEVVEPLAGTSRQRTFHYVVTETRSAAGVTNDRRSTRDIYITVTDDGHGKLTAEFTDANGAPLTTGQPDLTFTNVYKPAPTPSSVTGQVTITKVLTGRGMDAGEFSFEMLEDGIKVATGTNAADGTVTLSAVTYDAPGTHSYEIREVNGGKTIDGVRYSGTTYHVNTTVSDTGNGALAVTHELVEEGPATFTNAYETTPADVTITAHKELLGATLTDGQFAFQLTGMGSDLRATNDAQGNVAFPHLLLTEPGTYTYELCELNDGQEGVTYDERVYVVTVTVTDDGLGHLSAEVSMDAADGALAFTNTYTPPVTPEEPPAPKPPTKPDPAPAPKPARPSRPLPKAGDVTSDAIVVTLVAVAVALLAGTLAMRRRR
ncbi:Spy0128 family protein [Paratractidigestivibacter faecalis]|uniref:Spy0128 family protein n=1 Tax=Paratractidigestivibacter faecalis TaxID=2292441 RepID=UPI003AB63E82